MEDDRASVVRKRCHAEIFGGCMMPMCWHALHRWKCVDGGGVAIVTVAKQARKIAASPDETRYIRVSSRGQGRSCVVVR